MTQVQEEAGMIGAQNVGAVGTGAVAAAANPNAQPAM